MSCPSWSYSWSYGEHVVWTRLFSFLSFVFLCFSTRRFALDYTPHPTLLYWSTYTHKNASSWMIRSSRTFIFVYSSKSPCVPSLCSSFSFNVAIHSLQSIHNCHSFALIHWHDSHSVCSLTAKGVKLFLQRIYFFTAATFSRSVLRTPGRGSICLRSLRQWSSQSQFLPPQS